MRVSEYEITVIHLQKIRDKKIYSFSKQEVSIVREVSQGQRRARNREKGDSRLSIQVIDR